MTESSFLGSNLNLVKEHNLRAVLLSLLYEGSLSRIQLAQKTSLSATTITNLVEELLAQGVICSAGETTSEERHVGRPRAGLRLVDDSRFAVGVQLRVGIFRVGITNLTGKLVDCVEVEFSYDPPAGEVISKIGDTINALIERSGIDRSKIVGVGLGATGLINYSTGVNILAANFGWQDVPIRDWLMEQLGLPVVVDNNVRCMALGEAFFGVGRGVSSLAFIYARYGIGAGIVVNGRLYRGSGLGAGEIGHTIILPHNGPLCRCGQTGCLETLAAEPSLIRQAEQLAKEHPGSLLAGCMADTGVPRLIKRLFNAYRMGDPYARQLIDSGSEYLGIALANLVNLFTPDLILLGGLFEEEHAIILPIAREVMERTAFGGLGKQAHLQVTSFGRQAGMIGAASLALAKFFYHNSEDV